MAAQGWKPAWWQLSRRIERWGLPVQVLGVTRLDDLIVLQLDAEEAVLRYRVPSGVQGLMVTTEGSAFDTAVYARTACSQAAGGADLACNNDSYDHAPQSTIYLTNVIEGQELFLVVDGNAAMDTTSRGAFTLTVRQVAFGAMGTPCNRVTDPPTARCTGALRCSEGGAADGGIGILEGGG